MASMRASCAAQISLLRVSRAALDAPGPGIVADGIASAHVPSAAQATLLRVCRATFEVCQAAFEANAAGCRPPAMGAPMLTFEVRDELPFKAEATGSGAPAKGEPMLAKWMRARRQYSTESADILSSPWPARYFISARQRLPPESSQALER